MALLGAWIQQNLLQKRHIKQNLLEWTRNPQQRWTFKSFLLSSLQYYLSLPCRNFQCLNSILFNKQTQSKSRTTTSSHLFLTSFPDCCAPFSFCSHRCAHWSLVHICLGVDSELGLKIRWRGSRWTSPKNKFEAQAETDYPGYSWRRTYKRRHEKRHVSGGSGRIYMEYYE